MLGCEETVAGNSVRKQLFSRTLQTRLAVAVGAIASRQASNNVSDDQGCRGTSGKHCGACCICQLLSAGTRNQDLDGSSVYNVPENRGVFTAFVR